MDSFDKLNNKTLKLVNKINELKNLYMNANETNLALENKINDYMNHINNLNFEINSLKHELKLKDSQISALERSKRSRNKTADTTGNNKFTEPKIEKPKTPKMAKSPKNNTKNNTVYNVDIETNKPVQEQSLNKYYQNNDYQEQELQQHQQELQQHQQDQQHQQHQQDQQEQQHQQDQQDQQHQQEQQQEQQHQQDHQQEQQQDQQQDQQQEHQQDQQQSKSNINELDKTNLNDNYEILILEDEKYIYEVNTLNLYEYEKGVNISNLKLLGKIKMFKIKSGKEYITNTYTNKVYNYVNEEIADYCGDIINGKFKLLEK